MGQATGSRPSWVRLGARGAGSSSAELLAAAATVTPLPASAASRHRCHASRTESATRNRWGHSCSAPLFPKAPWYVWSCRALLCLSVVCLTRALRNPDSAKSPSKWLERALVRCDRHGVKVLPGRGVIRQPGTAAPGERAACCSGKSFPLVTTVLFTSGHGEVWGQVPTKTSSLRQNAGNSLPAERCGLLLPRRLFLGSGDFFP